MSPRWILLMAAAGLAVLKRKPLTTYCLGRYQMWRNEMSLPPVIIEGCEAAKGVEGEFAFAAAAASSESAGVSDALMEQQKVVTSRSAGLVPAVTAELLSDGNGNWTGKAPDWVCFHVKQPDQQTIDSSAPLKTLHIHVTKGSGPAISATPGHLEVHGAEEVLKIPRGRSSKTTVKIDSGITKIILNGNTYQGAFSELRISLTSLALRT